MPAMREDSQSAAKGSELDLLSHIAPEIRVLEKQPTSLCELLIPICTEAYQKDGNLRDETQIDRRSREDRSSTTQGCKGTRPAIHYIHYIHTIHTIDTIQYIQYMHTLDYICTLDYIHDNDILYCI